MVDGRVLHFKKAIIATGARPNIPPIAGIDKIDVLTSQNVFSLDELPRRLGVIGAGPIGCELAQAFARFGSHVYLFESSADILPREDPEAADIVSAALQRDGVRLVASVRDLEFRAESSGVHISANLQQETLEVEVDQVLLATGRRANIEDLDLDAAQVNYESDRGIRVDDYGHRIVRFTPLGMSAQHINLPMQQMHWRELPSGMRYWVFVGGRAAYIFPGQLTLRRK